MRNYQCLIASIHNWNKVREIISTILETFLIEAIYKKSRWSHPKYNKLKKSCVNFVIIASPALFIYPCYSSMFTVFANFFLLQWSKTSYFKSHAYLSLSSKMTKHHKKLTKNGLLLMLNPCVCVCVKLVYDSCQRECHNMLTHLSISLFFVESWVLEQYKNFKKEKTNKPFMGLKMGLKFPKIP